MTSVLSTLTPVRSRKLRSEQGGSDLIIRSSSSYDRVILEVILKKNNNSYIIDTSQVRSTGFRSIQSIFHRTHGTFLPHHPE